MPQIMTTKELAKYLKLHEITICKYAAEGKIPAIRIGRVWRFDKEAIDKWISGGQKKWYDCDMENKKETNGALFNRSSAMLMLDKKEQKLLKEILRTTLRSRSARTWIVKKLGKEYVQIGQNLLKILGGG